MHSHVTVGRCVQPCPTAAEVDKFTLNLEDEGEVMKSSLSFKEAGAVTCSSCVGIQSCVVIFLQNC